MNSNEISDRRLPCRPWLHLVNIWLVAAAGLVLMRAIQWRMENIAWNLAAMTAILAAAGAVGRIAAVRRILAAVLYPELTLGDVHVSTHGQIGIAGDNDRSTVASSRRWCSAGLALMMLLMLLVELRQHYFFVQDDNTAQFLPVVLDGCRSLLDDGVFPRWNAHQYLGSPTTSLGIYALTYPLTYVSYAVARYVLHDEFATFEVFCIGHLLAGYLAAFWAARCGGIRPVLAAAVGICFSFSGFFLIAGRSWYYMTPTALWLPLLVGLLEQFRRRPVGWKWVLATGVVLGAMFHAGNVQMWCYATMLFAIGVGALALCRAVPRCQVLPAIAALLLGVAIAMPLLICQYLETADLSRTADDHTVLELLPMLLPYPLIHNNEVALAGSAHAEHIGQLQYAGTFFSLMALAGMLSLVVHRWNRSTIVHNYWLLLGGIALLLGLGHKALLWYYMGFFPPFSGFTQAKKFIPFATLFMLLGAALMLERAFARWNVAWRWQVRTAAISVALVATQAWMPIPSFCDYAFQPYPKLPARLQQLVDAKSQGRIYSAGPRRSMSPQYAQTMSHQLPSLWGNYALEGYDPLVAQQPRFLAVDRRLAEAVGMDHQLHSAQKFLHSLNFLDPLLDAAGWQRYAPSRIDLRGDADSFAMKVLKAYGVRWIVVFTAPQQPAPNLHPFWQTEHVPAQISKLAEEELELATETGGVAVYEVPDPAPLAFAASKPDIALPVQFDDAGFQLDLPAFDGAREVVVNVLSAPWLQVKADGQPIAATVDHWGRMVLHIPARTKKLQATYSPPWRKGGVIGGMLAAIALAVMRIYRRRFGNLVNSVEGKQLAFPAMLRAA